MVHEGETLLSPQDGRGNAGAGLAGIIAMMVMASSSARLDRDAGRSDGGFTYTHYNPLQTVVILGWCSCRWR